MAGKDEGSDGERDGSGSESSPGKRTVAPLVSNGIEETNHRDNHRGERGQQSTEARRISFAEWIMIVFTAVTALATWAGIYISNGQWDVATNQMDIARNQMSDARESSKQSAKDTQAALNLSTRAANAAEKEATVTQTALSIATRSADAAVQEARASQESAEIGRAQLKTAIAALREEQAPHVRLWADNLSGFNEDGEIQAMGHVKNVSRVDVV